MARGGIDKALVKKARLALLAKGQNPSIDTVRIELGNTGSKTTIHRYLKELELEEGTQLDDEALLSATIKQTIATLANQLFNEANILVKNAETAYDEKYEQWKLTSDEQILATETLETKLHVITGELSQAKKALEIGTDKYNISSNELKIGQQKLDDQERVLASKDAYIQSLEEKHQHSRASLTHYRESVKEQREQDARVHEQAIQQLQIEQRNLQQTLSMKQTEVTQVNKDSARLAAELSDSRKQILISQEQISDQKNEVKNIQKTLTVKETKLDSQSIELKQSNETCINLKKALSIAQEEKQMLEVNLAKLEMEVQIKDEVFKKIGVFDQ